MIKNINKLKIILSTKKSLNHLNGIYKSIYKDSHINFKSLKNYEYGDNTKDIDWKKSSKTNNLLIKQFTRKTNNNIILLLDNGIKMDAQTQSLENKKDIVIEFVKIMSYILILNQDKIKIICGDSEINNTNLSYIEKQLTKYKNSNKEIDLNKTLKKIKLTTKRHLLFIVTDIKGIEVIDRNLLKYLSTKHDLYIIIINDHSIYGQNLFNVDKNKLIPKFFSKDKNLEELNNSIKSQIINSKLSNLNLSQVTISSKDEIINKMINLLKERKHENN